MSKNDHNSHGLEATNTGVIASARPTRLTRREVLGYMGAGAAMSLIGVPPAVSAQARSSPSCVVKPQQTEGPYFVDEKLNRADIRSDPTDGTGKSGAELRLAFNVTRIDGATCTPLAGAIVDVWHCDARGIYSDVSDGSFDTRGKQFLRGYQVTDKDGAARFITIFPGWYQGRTAHLHFKIRTEADPRHARGRAAPSTDS